MNFKGFVQKQLKRIMASIAHTIKRFTAYSLFLFFAGAVYGLLLVPRIASHAGFDPFFLLILPAFLAVFSYYFVEVATLLFVGLLLIFLLFFL